jgi:Transglutaminase-like superfamily
MISSPSACSRRMRRRLAPLRRLRGRRELWLFVRVLAVAPFFQLLLRLPLPVVDQIIAKMRRPAPQGLEPQRVAAVVGAAQTFAHPVVRHGCLTRGLTLYWLLAEPSSDLRLCFGLGGPADDFTGHCWIERAGEPYLETEDPRERFPEQFAIPMRTGAGDPASVSSLA